MAFPAAAAAAATSRNIAIAKHPCIDDLLAVVNTRGVLVVSVADSADGVSALNTWQLPSDHPDLTAAAWSPDPDALVLAVGDSRGGVAVRAAAEQVAVEGEASEPSRFWQTAVQRSGACAVVPVQPFIAHAGHAVSAMQFHPVQAALLATASPDQSVRLWNVPTGVCVAVLQFALLSSPSQVFFEVNCMSFDTHGSKIVAGGERGFIAVWDLSSKELSLAFDRSFATVSSSDTPQRPCFLMPSFATLRVLGGMQRGKDSVVASCVRFLGDAVLASSSEGNSVTVFEQLGDFDPEDGLGWKVSVLAKLRAPRNKKVPRFCLNTNNEGGACATVFAGDAQGAVYWWPVVAQVEEIESSKTLPEQERRSAIVDGCLTLGKVAVAHDQPFDCSCLSLSDIRKPSELCCMSSSLSTGN
eukprot:m51a1_g2606 hypothetical protein (413) ;mRNA; f:471925-473372